jgi:hypothetical protein
MANVRNANTFYIDTQSSGASDNLVIKGLAVYYVAVTATGASGRVVLQDAAASPVTKLDLRSATSGVTEFFDFSN